MRVSFCLVSAPWIAVALSACGGDNDKDNNPDANSNDAAAVDANTTPTTAGLIAITDVQLTNPRLAGFTGGQVRIAFSNLSTATVAPVPGYDNPVGGCLITAYDVDASETEPTEVDGGDVAVTGTNIGDFTCSFVSDSYVCTLDNAAASGAVGAGSTVSANEGALNYNIVGADFSGVDMRGTYVSVNGFDNVAANGTFPCLGDDNAQTLYLGNPDGAAVGATAASGSYVAVVGQGPIPGGFDFLDDGTNDIVISKALMGAFPAINQTLQANGGRADNSSIVLDSVAGSLPHAMPTDGSAVTFTCGTGANPCGATGGGVLNGMTLSGRTTDASIVGLDPNDMPDPMSRFVTFTCSAPGQTEATLDAGAMAAILGTTSGSPTTRIQTSVTYAAGAVVGTTNIVVGHNVTGWTDVPAIVAASP